MKAKTLIVLICSFLSFANAQTLVEQKFGDTLIIQINKLGENINSNYSDFSPVISADGLTMFFTSRRPNDINNKKTSEDFEQIYISTYDKNLKKWNLSVKLASPLNIEGDHSSNISISNDGQHMLLYMYDRITKGDIYESFLKGNEWTEPVRLSEPINSKRHESSASFSPDGNTIYFISDRGKKGNRDIYFSKKNKKGKWSEPKPIINLNSELNEEAVFIHPDGKTMFFSSNRKEGYGGYDIYKTVCGKNEKWSTPINLGEPINTPENDLFFVLTADGKKAYYSSNREGSIGEKDIFEIEFISTEKKIEKGPALVLLKGRVFDSKTKLPIEASIEIVNVKNGEKISNLTSNSVSGNYMISLPSGVNYGIYISKLGYLHFSDNVNLPESDGYKEIDKDIYLEKIEIGSKMVLNNIFFDYGKATLTNESTEELMKIYTILNENNSLKIEISAHTDSRGKDDANKILSEYRAKAVVDFLINKGISENRMIYKGYGRTMPIYSDDIIQKQKSELEKEKMHSLNRRIEFKILSN